MAGPRRAAAVLALLAVLLPVGTGCRQGSPGEGEMRHRSIEQVLKAHADAWLALPGVVGAAVGLSEGRAVIKVFVAARTADLAAGIPASVEGYPVVIEESGEVRALGGR